MNKEKIEKAKITKKKNEKKIIITNGQTTLTGFKTFSEARNFFNNFLMQNYVKTR